MGKFLVERKGHRLMTIFQMELQSFFMMIGVGILLSGLIFFIVEHYSPNSLAGGREWGSGNIVLIVGFVLFAYRDQIPDIFSITLANLLIVLSPALYYLAVSKINQQEFNLRGAAWVISLTAITLICFTHIWPNYSVRVVAMSISPSIFLIWIQRLINQNNEPEIKGVKLVTSSLAAVLMSTYVVRGSVAIVNYDPIGTLATDNTLVNFAIGASFIVAILLMVAFIMYANANHHLELRRMAYQDSLTETLTRRAIMGELEKHLADTRRKQRDLSILLIDVDKLKHINDNFGHLAGDEALVKVAETTTRLLREGDSIGRFGGDEFIVVLPETTLPQTESIAERLLNEIKQIQYSFNGRVSVSLGGAGYESKEDTVDSLISRADANLYEVKDQGGDGYIVLKK